MSESSNPMTDTTDTELERLMDDLVAGSEHVGISNYAGEPHEMASARVATARAALRSYFSERTLDTRRLDWLENNPDVIHPAAAVSPGWNMEGFHDEEDGWGSEDLNLWNRTLRGAIDKALLKESPDDR